MRFNPCGRPVDIGSAPFKTKYRPFRDSDVEVEILWYPALRSAEPLPWVSCISNPFWERDQYEHTDGFLPLDNVVRTGKPEFKPGTGRGHVCGTEEDFREGGSYALVVPPTQYGAQGLPTCCGAAVPLSGGVRDSGRVEVIWPTVPGSSCLTAPLVDFETTYNFSVPSAGVWWVRYDPVAALQTWYFVSDLFTGVPNAFFTGFNSGASCALLSACGDLVWGPDSHLILSNLAGSMWLIVTSSAAASFTGKVTATPP